MIDELAPDRVENVTVLHVGRIGDLVVGTALLKALQRRFARARVKLVAGALCQDLLPLIPWVDDAVTIHRFHRALANLKAAAGLATQRCDLLVDLNPSPSRTSAALAALVRAPVKAGFRKGRLDSAFTHTAAPAGEREHMLDCYSRLAFVLGLAYEPAPEVRLNPADETRGENILKVLDPDDSGLRVLIHPGNFKKHENRWPEEKFVDLTNRLLDEPGLKLFYMAGPGEEERVRAITGALKTPVPLLPVTPLGVTGAAMRLVDACVLNITGTTHLAAALGTATFGFYSGYTDAVWRPRGPRHGGVVSKSWESCRDIGVDEAHAALKAFLASLRRGR